jgi:hypothetical protein
LQIFDVFLNKRYALLHQGLKLGLVLLVVWVVWAVLTGSTGSQSPLFVVREDVGASFSRGDLLLLQWGKLAFEQLRAGDVLVYQQMASDPLPTVSRIMAVHKVVEVCFLFLLFDRLVFV